MLAKASKFRVGQLIYRIARTDECLCMLRAQYLGARGGGWHGLRNQASGKEWSARVARWEATEVQAVRSAIAFIVKLFGHTGSGPACPCERCTESFSDLSALCVRWMQLTGREVRFVPPQKDDAN